MADVARTAATARAFPPGAVERQGQRAGVVSRLVAMVIDIAYVAAIAGALYLAYDAVRFLRHPLRFTWPQAPLGVWMVAAGVLAVLVLTAAWTGLGRTVGMRMMGLRIQTIDGRRVHAGRAFLRAITCVVFPLALLWCAVSKRNASLHDLVFGTSVIYDWETRVPEARLD